MLKHLGKMILFHIYQISVTTHLLKPPVASQPFTVKAKGLPRNNVLSYFPQTFIQSISSTFWSLHLLLLPSHLEFSSLYLAHVLSPLGERPSLVTLSKQLPHTPHSALLTALASLASIFSTCLLHPTRF